MCYGQGVASDGTIVSHSGIHKTGYSKPKLEPRKNYNFEIFPLFGVCKGAFKYQIGIFPKFWTPLKMSKIFSYVCLL